MKKYILLIFALTTLSGCLPQDEKIERLENDIKELKQNLGQFQYMAVDPKISFINENIEFKKAESTYGSPSVKFTTHIKQNNSTFPLKIYELYVTYSVIDKDGFEIATFQGNGTIQNGFLSISDVTSLYGLKAGISLESLSIKIKEFIWFPKILLQPYDAQS